MYSDGLSGILSGISPDILFDILSGIFSCIYTQNISTYDMIIDLKVLARSFNWESRACYVGNPRESFFFRVCERNIFFSRKFCESWMSWLPNIGSAEDKHGVRESCVKVAFLFAKNGRSRIKEFWSTIIFIDIPLFMWHSFWHSIWHHLAYFLTL